MSDLSIRPRVCRCVYLSAAMNTKITEATGQALTTASLAFPQKQESISFRPETYRLPRPSERDPFWGLGRSWYYAAEKRGDIKLIRLRKRGNLRGVTLVPYEAVAQLIKQLA
jgi:hypothetical protein